MRELKSLRPTGLPDSFDSAIHGEQPIVEIEEVAGGLTIHYRFVGFYVSEDCRTVDKEKRVFQQINAAKMGFLAESGKPMLPSLGRYVQIPADSDYSFTVKEGRPTVFEGLTVLPAQEDVTDSEAPPLPFEYDEVTYNTDRNWPQEIVRVSGPFTLDGYKAALVHVTPFRYNPIQKKLLAYANVDVAFQFTPSTGMDAGFPADDRQLSREAYGNLFLNPRRSAAGPMAALVARGDTARQPPEAELLILYHPPYREAAERLARWKREKGLRTNTVSIESVGNEVPKIKKYVRAIRSGDLSPLRYLLLFGDVDQIASEEISESPWPSRYGPVATDYYYSTQRDPEHISDCVFPWLACGRIPVQTTTQAMAVVDQIIRYEKSPPTDPGYYRKFSFAAYFQDTSSNDPYPDGRASRAYMKTMEGLRNTLSSLGFDVERVYVSETELVQEYIDGTPVPEPVREAIFKGSEATHHLVEATRAGRLIIGHRDHGTEDGWHRPGFTTDDLDSISDAAPTMFFSINCLTGRFDLVAARECFAERLLAMDGGAPSLIASTRVSHTWLNDDLIKGLFDAMWAGILPTFPDSTVSYPLAFNRLGDMLNYAKAYLPVKSSGTAKYIKNHFEIYHVVGDPTLEMWKAKPLTVDLRASVTDSSLDILLSPCPHRSVITVWNGEQLLKRIEPSGEHIRVSVRGALLDQSEETAIPTFRVCFAAPGYRFQEALAQTSPA